jgi:hypothetical protein
MSKLEQDRFSVECARLLADAEVEFGELQTILAAYSLSKGSENGIPSSGGETRVVRLDPWPSAPSSARSGGLMLPAP